MIFFEILFSIVFIIWTAICFLTAAVEAGVAYPKGTGWCVLAVFTFYGALLFHLF